jgi:PPOX class probable F420-dependent enzyme
MDATPGRIARGGSSPAAARQRNSSAISETVMTEPIADRVREALAAESGAWAREHLAADVVGWLTTVAPDGRVQSSPISFLWDGATILFYSKPDTPKLRNVAAHPQVSFNLNSDPYADHMLAIEGVAAVEPDCRPSDVNPVYAAKYRAPLAHWGMDEAQTAREFSVAVRITPTRVRAW